MALLSVLLMGIAGARLRRVAPPLPGAGRCRHDRRRNCCSTCRAAKTAMRRIRRSCIGGGKVNRSFLVRTRRGRFVVRLNENAASDPGLDRDRELALHTRRGRRRHRAARHLRLPRPLLPDHRLRRRAALDAALLHAHARPARRWASACARCTRWRRRAVARFDPHGGRAPLRGTHRARRPGEGGAHRVTC